MREHGCSVHLLVEHAPASQTLIGQLHPHCYQMHDKFVVVNTPTQHLVIAGSEDLSLKALQVNDNEMVRTANYGAIAAYHHFMQLMWYRSGYCHAA